MLLDNIINVCRARKTFKFTFPNKSNTIDKFTSNSNEYNIIYVLESGNGRKSTLYAFDYAFCVYKDIPTHYLKNSNKVDKTRSFKTGNVISKTTKLDDDNCHPSFKTIGNALKMSRGTVKKYVDSLVEKQMIAVEQTSIVPNLGNKTVASLTTLIVQKFYNKLLSEGKSSSLVRDTHLILHQAMDVAVKENLIAKNPTDGTKIPKIEYKPKNILNETQLEMFMDAIKEDELWYDFFYTEITTGLRRGELCGLKWCDFNETTGQLNVVRTVTTHKGGELKTGETKTQKGTRTIYLPPSTVKLLLERKPKVSSEWIFPNFYDNTKPINPSTAYLKLKSILKNAGLPSIRFHDLRHTFATHALSSGVDARTLSGILGHTNASFTLDIYSHITDTMQLQAAARIDKGIGKNGDALKEIEKVSADSDKKPVFAKFEAQKGKHRKPGTGCVSKINDHLYEGKYSPRDANGKRISRNVYAKTREECEKN